MAEIINLRQVRKAKLRAAEESKAADNRIAFGRPKKAKTLEVERHEGHRLARGEPETDPSA